MALGTQGAVGDLGPAIAVWGSTTIAEIFEEVRLTLTGADPAEVFECLHGATPVDAIVGGYSACSVMIPATRTTLSVLAEILPGGSVSTSGIVLDVTTIVGKSMYDSGKPLFIKPIVDGVAAANGKWMRLERTYPVARWDVEFSLKGQRVFAVEFRAFPDETSKYLWSAGKVNEGTSY